MVSLSNKYDVEVPVWCYDYEVSFSEMLGEVLLDVSVDDAIIEFITSDNYYRLYHDQGCCEHVYVESVVGDLEDLIGEPLLLAECVTSDENPVDPEYDDSFTWTFYKLATIKGYIDLRWYGSSNGYYSESVELIKLPRNKQ